MIKKFVIASMMTLSSMAAMAGSQTWDFGTQHTSGNVMGNTLQYSVDGIDLTVSAWASTSAGCNTGGGYGSGTGSGDPDPCVKNAKLVQHGSGSNYSGLGIINRDEQSNGVTGSPNHAIDNIKNGGNHEDLDFEMVLLTFSEAVNLSGVNVGWTGCSSNGGNCDSAHNDADMSILAYTRNNTNPGFFNSHTRWADIVGSGTNGGWNLIQESSDVDDYNTLGVSNPNNVTSRYWLVGAYNEIFGGTHWTDSNDAFKLKGLVTASHVPPTGTVDVNAPATLFMFASFAALALFRRKS